MRKLAALKCVRSHLKSNGISVGHEYGFRIQFCLFRRSLHFVPSFLLPHYKFLFNKNTFWGKKNSNQNGDHNVSRIRKCGWPALNVCGSPAFCAILFFFVVFAICSIVRLRGLHVLRCCVQKRIQYILVSFFVPLLLILFSVLFQFIFYLRISSWLYRILKHVVVVRTHTHSHAHTSRTHIWFELGRHSAHQTNERRCPEISIETAHELCVAVATNRMHKYFLGSAKLGGADDTYLWFHTF